MGWERKRGKLLDLNKLLTGEFDAFPIKAGDIEVLREVRFVLTLDTDTQLPRGVAPKLYNRLADDVSKKQAVCIAGYSGHFTSSEVSKAMGQASGTLAVAVVATPGNKLLGTLILTKLPVRFQHTHPF